MTNKAGIEARSFIIVTLLKMTNIARENIFNDKNFKVIFYYKIRRNTVINIKKSLRIFIY